jgi:hypothetical protein
LVCDFQGVGNLLTDPAIHTSNPERFKLSDPNLGKEGFKFFFQSHVCNAICTRLGLKSNKSMVVSENYTFRERWPSMDITECCSNKLCGRIVHIAAANKSQKYPEYCWCSICWPQLQSTSQLMCVSSGPVHEFEVSKFFYETQGRSTPRTCPEHREENIEMSRVAEANGSLWSRLGFGHRREEVPTVSAVLPPVLNLEDGLMHSRDERDVVPALQGVFRKSLFSAPVRQANVDPVKGLKRLTLGHLEAREARPPPSATGRTLSTRLSLGHLEDRTTGARSASPYGRRAHEGR